MARGVLIESPSVSQGASLRGYSRFLLVALFSLASFQLSACTKSGEETASVAPRRSSVRSAHRKPLVSPEGGSQGKPQSVPPPDLFERDRRVQFELSSELIRSLPEKFSRSALESQKIHHAPASENTELWLAIDHHAPRRARGSHFVISDLVNEDLELSPGSHFLTAFEWGEAEKGRLQLSAFFVDVGPESLPRSPGCLLATPLLTKNGTEASGEIRFLSVPLSPDLDRVEYRAEAEGLISRGDAPPGTEVVLRRPPAGDVGLSIRCFSGGEQVASDDQTVTLNPEARGPEQRQ